MTKMLPPAKHETAKMYAAGIPCAEIARRRGVTVKAAYSDVCKIRKVLGAATREDVAVALQSTQVGANWRKSTQGFVRGGAVRVTGGRYAGKAGVYVGGCNSTQVRVLVGAAVLLIDPKSLEVANG